MLFYNGKKIKLKIIVGQRSAAEPNTFFVGFINQFV